MKTSIPTLAHQTPEVINGETYESLEAFIHLSLNELPEGVRTAMTPTLKMFWDELLPDGRRSQAKQYDSENDPAMEPERKYWRSLVSVIWETETAITRWERTNDGGTPSEALIRESQLAALGDRLANLERMYKLPPFLVQDWKALTDDALAKVVQDATAPVLTAAPAQTPATSAPEVAVETASDGRVSLTTNDIAGCFAGFHEWGFKGWKDNLQSPAPVGAVEPASDGRATRERKPSWSIVAMPYMKSLFTSGNYRSCAVFYEALKLRANDAGSPFKLVNHELYCTDAGTTVSKGSVGNFWAEIRGR